jgi:hypothetical protein
MPGFLPLPLLTRGFRFCVQHQRAEENRFSFACVVDTFAPMLFVLRETRKLSL